MLISGIKSKPVYRPLEPDPSGQRHLLIAHGQGGEAIRRLYDAFGANASGIEIYYARESGVGRDCAGLLSGLPTQQTRIYERVKEMEKDLTAAFRSAQMGIRLYFAGSEAAIWPIINLATAVGLCEDEIQREESDSFARRVYCTHCKAVTEGVRTNIYKCVCGRHLLVRDHFSKRLAGYMAVQVDAEVPGERPAVEEIYVP